MLLYSSNNNMNRFEINAIFTRKGFLLEDTDSAELKGLYQTVTCLITLNGLIQK